MEEIIRYQDRFYILATSSRVDDQTRVLKHGDTFAVFDRQGNIQPVGLGEQGLFHEGTRFLSRLELLIDGHRPLLLSSTVTENNALLVVDMTNPDAHSNGDLVRARDSIHIFRTSVLWDGACYERVRVRNYGLTAVQFTLRFLYDADFADIFEVRGVHRSARGTMLEPVIGADRVVLRYRGLDSRERQTRLEFSPFPQQLTDRDGVFAVDLPPHGESVCHLTVLCDPPPEKPRPFHEVMHRTAEEFRANQEADALIHTSNEQFNEWLNRSAADLHMMVTQTPDGPYIYAGVPWFSTVFGRDGIITALEYLWINPQLARGVLACLAANQATELNPEQDAEPGKILHEMRCGEMAALGEIPFGRYYGSVDSTPLFIVLAGAYYERTNDLQFIQSIWPNIEKALGWIDQYGDADNDGLVDYVRRSSKGLVTQGWKDSFDSVFHSDGTLASGPVELCEVQAYVFAARRAVARLATALGYSELATESLHRSERLRDAFERVFWCDALGTYAIARDGKERMCQVRTSNPGHCLFAGMVHPDRARRTVKTLMHESSFSGWGIRTVADTEARYNPMSYHNGSIWPHDNALIAYGMARYGMKRAAMKVLSGLFDASMFMDLHRMPELFCGFTRRPGEGPTLYPVACAPQAWAAASVFLILQACLGLSIDATRSQICFTRPRLPRWLPHVRIRHLRVGSASVDLALDRHARDVAIKLLRRDGNVEIVNVK